MASQPIDFCEPANPRVLDEVRRVNRFENARRIHNGLTSTWEQRALTWMAERTPGWINSDHLTILGLLAQVMAGVSYALARWNRYWLLAVIGFLALNWLGDSLDGTIARVRQQLRPRYGFYVDHIADSFGGLALMAGLALSGYMRPSVAIGLLVAFLFRPLIFPRHYRLFDVGGVIGLIGMSVMLIFFTARNTRRLYLEERIT